MLGSQLKSKAFVEMIDKPTANLNVSKVNMNSNWEESISRYPVDAFDSLSGSIHHYYELCALALQVADGPIKDVQLPGTTFGLTGDQNRDLSQLRNQFKLWALQSGLRDCAEILHLFLEEIRHLCAMSAFLKQPERVNQRKYEKKVAAGDRNFHNLRFGQKLDLLVEEFAVSAPEEVKSSVENLHWIRNCLAHRAAIVGQQDIAPGATEARAFWHAPQLIAQDQKGATRPVELGSPTREGESISLTRISREKGFPLGSRVMFTTTEFSEICFTYLWFGLAIADSTEVFMKSQGTELKRSEPKINIDLKYMVMPA